MRRELRPDAREPDRAPWRELEGVGVRVAILGGYRDQYGAKGRYWGVSAWDDPVLVH